MDSRIGRQVGSYIIEKQIGKGQFGTVYLAKHFQTAQPFAVKCIARADIEKNSKLSGLLRTEVSIMNKIKHPNVMHLFEFLESSNNYYMVIQYCNGGDLESHIRKQPKGLLPESEAVFYLKQIMNGENYASRAAFTFESFQIFDNNCQLFLRDFKLANIFLHDGKAVIGDFGFAKAGYEMANTKLGTPVTMAPELHMEKTSYNNKADLWSIGVVYFEMLYGDNPFFGLNIQEIMAKIRSRSGPNLKFDDNLNKISELSKDLLRKLLEMDPDRRIEWEGFFKHPLFDTVSSDVVSAQSSPDKQAGRNLGVEHDHMPLRINSTPGQITDGGAGAEWCPLH